MVLVQTASKCAGGAVKVDANSCTNVSNIYAVGDITDRICLTPVALHEGHCFADSLYGGKPRQPDHDAVASAAFSTPQIGTVGITEAEAAKKFRNLAVYTSTFRPMMHTMTQRESRTYMKLIEDLDTGLVVGVHMCGDDAAEIIQGIGIAVKMQAKKSDFDRTIGIHPTAAEEFVTMRSPSYWYQNGTRCDQKP